MFKESSSSIMITTNLNWSTEILWYETGYSKEKMLSPLERPTLRQAALLVLSKIAKNLFPFFFFILSFMFLALASVNNSYEYFQLYCW